MHQGVHFAFLAHVWSSCSGTFGLFTEWQQTRYEKSSCIDGLTNILFRYSYVICWVISKAFSFETMPQNKDNSSRCLSSPTSRLYSWGLIKHKRMSPLSRTNASWSVLCFTAVVLVFQALVAEDTLQIAAHLISSLSTIIFSHITEQPGEQQHWYTCTQHANTETHLIILWQHDPLLSSSIYLLLLHTDEPIN